jgi:hypothetical protein
MGCPGYTAPGDMPAIPCTDPTNPACPNYDHCAVDNTVIGCPGYLPPQPGPIPIPGPTPGPDIDPIPDPEPVIDECTDPTNPICPNYDECLNDNTLPGCQPEPPIIDEPDLGPCALDPANPLCTRRLEEFEEFEGVLYSEPNQPNNVGAADAW